jgi:ribonucleoside-triphosphate reductase
MILPIEKDDAAIRSNFTSEVYQAGVKLIKELILQSLHTETRNLHENGSLHIHDLEAYGKVPNCASPDLVNFITSKSIKSATNTGKIAFAFNAQKDLIMNLAMYQSGGIGFVNMDTDMTVIFDVLDVVYNDENCTFFSECVLEFIHWINTTRTRYCREPYYLTFNVGLSTSPWGRETTKNLLSTFMDSPIAFTRPNIVFKVSKIANSVPDAPNYDLYQLALACTAKRMIPTYLLLDSPVNKNCSPTDIGIMGCRTRVYQNINGKETTIGRGNIAYVSINLPRIALSVSSVNAFFQRLDALMISSAQILKNRAEATVHNDTEYLSFIKDNHIWANVENTDDMLQQGTLSIGFIGLSETAEVLTGKKFYIDNDAFSLALTIVRRMREFVDTLRATEHRNYSLLATPGEMISGRFCKKDSEYYPNPIQEKGFYTNSFHVDVDSGLSLFDKIDREGPFHALCNGGSISYVEFSSAPLSNIEALSDAIQYAERKGISYFGFNYPLDICNNCNASGTFDTCLQCGSTDIKHLRRVSGYLEDVNYFTIGKAAEAKRRTPNNNIGVKNK